MKEVRELIREGRTRLSVSDKGGEFVVIPRQLDIAITNKHLEDAFALPIIFCKGIQKAKPQIKQ
ncbi:hypothetical protein KIN20_024892 [Parelaphostrongylus tenuis]|uniref:Uncharacterized protein n=1 Tax=Parelaphostrongylus tenuis TaxID=148309 RepID=A0AAD5QTZ2_PARTN|nr:hypothetical protein KIN20_024892 [Parelaphostrongylus tenuis]